MPKAQNNEYRKFYTQSFAKTHDENNGLCQRTIKTKNIYFFLFAYSFHRKKEEKMTKTKKYFLAILPTAYIMQLVCRITIQGN